MAQHRNSLEQFGFHYGRGSVHMARTMMLNELSLLLDYARDEQWNRK
jgi:hypothetical protein